MSRKRKFIADGGLFDIKGWGKTNIYTEDISFIPETSHLTLCGPENIVVDGFTVPFYRDDDGNLYVTGLQTLQDEDLAEFIWKHDQQFERLIDRDCFRFKEDGK